MSDSISGLLEKAFDKILPIPKTPRVYRPPPPPKPVSWVPSGSLKNDTYVRRLKDFALEIKAIDAQRTKRIKASSRGWCYLLEGLGLIHKGEFDKTQTAINDCRKKGFLPLDFVKEDQDITRRFAGIHEADDPTTLLRRLKDEVEDMLGDLPSQTVDYWEDEEYYLMMCTEKGDLRNLFEPICDEYHVPIVSSKGWYTILSRARIASLSMKAEKRGLKPVLLLFYDHDIAGLKITKKFRKGLHDISDATGWEPWNLEIYRFGLNADDVEKYGLMRIDNLKSSRGRDPDWSRNDVKEYVRKFGINKCESNAIFKNDETLRVGEEICRKAIEKYYGEDALERFEKKEEKARESLKDVYDDQIWDDFNERIDELIETLSEETDEESSEVEEEAPEPSKIFETEAYRIAPDGRLYYGKCPKCGRYFDYELEFVGRIVRCRRCNAPMKIVKPKKREEET